VKRLILLLAAVAAAALLVVPVASARTSLFPDFLAHPARWLAALREHPRNPPPPQSGHGTTVSLYEQTANTGPVRRQGCRAGEEERSGVAILDFGKPAFSGRHFGTILFSGRFAANWKITSALLAYATGYVHCLPAGSTATLTLARGTSNYHPAMQRANVYRAGRSWARYTYRLGELLAKDGLSSRVASAAADDAEPAWDPVFHKTRDFFRGYASFFLSYPSVAADTLYDYGSLDGGVGAIWNAHQAYFVSGGMRYAQALPEIYSTAMAMEWGQLAQVVQRRFHRQVRFAGVLTQLSRGCRRCSLEPGVAHRALRRALAAYGASGTPLPAGGSNMGDY
jgi:hypothetical protein